MREKEFVEAVRDYAVNWSARAGIDASVLATDDLSIPITVEEELVRVLQEALSNVARHSQAKIVAVSIGAVDNELVLTVQDMDKGLNYRISSSRILR